MGERAHERANRTKVSGQRKSSIRLGIPGHDTVASTRGGSEDGLDIVTHTVQTWFRAIPVLGRH